MPFLRQSPTAVSAGFQCRGGSREEGMQYIKDTFYSGYMQTIYPEDALNLNSSIMVELVEKEMGEK